MKKLLCITRNKQETFYKILMLTKNKLNSIETVVSQVLADMEINHEEFNAIIKEKQKHETIKENKQNVSEKQGNMRLNSLTSKKKHELITDDFNCLKDVLA